MSFIPKVAKSYPDELLYSWIVRMSKENGLSLSSFSKAYLDRKNAAIEKFKLDVRYEFTSLYNKLYKKDNMKQMYLSLTTYQFESLFMSSGKQTRYINNVFRNKSSMNTSVNCLFNSVNICEECVDEDIKMYGAPYLHRSHQLSGVRTCHKHDISLLIYKGKGVHSCDFEMEDYVKLDKAISVNQVKYTHYVQALFEAGIHGTSKLFTKILEDKLKVQNYSLFIKEFINNGYDEKFISDLEYLIRKKMNRDITVRPEEVIPICMILFPDVNEIISKLKHAEPNIELYHCSICKKYYCSTVEGFKNGWGCPYCDDNEDYTDKLRLLIYNMDSSYKLTDEFESLIKPVSMHHSYCDSEIIIKPRDFLFRGRRCECNTYIVYNVAKERIETNRGFELKEFTNSREPVKILSKSCGHIFTSTYINFISSPSCKICHPKIISEELFESRVRDLVGDEFTITKGFKTYQSKVEVRHNKCGTVHSYYPTNFTRRPECLYCKSIKEDTYWYREYQMLCKYKDEFGHTMIPARYIYKGHKLGMWINNQRTLKKQGKLHNLRMQMLQDINFCWDMKEYEWDSKYILYKRYIEITGSDEIANRAVFEGVNLGDWVQAQRSLCRQGKMTPERLNKLKKINFNFEYKK